LFALSPYAEASFLLAFTLLSFFFRYVSLLLQTKTKSKNKSLQGRKNEERKAKKKEENETRAAS